MSEDNNFIESANDLRKKIKLREPETVLRTVYGKDLQVLKCESSSLVSMDEHYGSTIIKLKLTVKKDKNEREEIVDLVAKMLPPTEVQRFIFDSPNTFKKEVFFYRDLIPIYQNLYNENSETERYFDIVPKFYGSRLSLKNTRDEVDEDAVILLENLKTKGYYMADRFEGLDLDHMKVAVKEVAKFHGIGISVQHKKPESYQTFVKYSKIMPASPAEVVKKVHEQFREYAKDDAEISCHLNLINDIVLHELKNVFHWYIDPNNPWHCVIHGDLWLNNMLFHKNDENHVDDVKLVDFQTYNVNSALRDLLFLLFTSTTTRVLKDNFDELIDLYRIELESVLREVGCDVEFMAGKKFFEKLKEDANREFVHFMFMLKVVKLGQDENLESRLEIGLNNHYKERMRDVISVFKEKFWD